jgi:hypothetical protein
MSFTKILNKGIRRYIDKNRSRRKYGKCESCHQYKLLIEYLEPDDVSSIWMVCDQCYEDILENEDD